MKSILFAAAMVLAGAAQAGPITVTYSGATAQGFTITGSFSGIDANGNGVLSLSELSAWTNSYSPVEGLTSLNAFGDYNIQGNTWLANATDPYHAGSLVFMTWHDWKFSVASPAFTFTTTLVPTAPDSLPNNAAPVPEPASLALSAIGATALALGRRRRRRRAAA